MNVAKGHISPWLLIVSLAQAKENRKMWEVYILIFLFLAPQEKQYFDQLFSIVDKDNVRTGSIRVPA